ncbi:MAG: TniQ family protein [Pyrinomonadaceae bacterium]
MLQSPTYTNYNDEITTFNADEFSGHLWPIHLKPMEDELLSSWLVRLARFHGLKLHKFSSTVWPGKQIWNRDIDKSADAEIVRTLSVKTGTPVERVKVTTLAAYEDILYEKHNLFGPSSWIMPVGVYHRTRKKFGLQYCPLCLAEDKEPYYRRKWRLAFMVLCEKHHIVLYDRCSKCAEPINFHRDELGNHRKQVATSLTRCHVCRFDLRTFKKRSVISTTPTETKFTIMLLQAMNVGFMKISADVTIYALLYFAGLRQLMKIVAMRDKRIDRLRQAISKEYGVEDYSPVGLGSHADVQELSLESRRQLLGLVRCLVEQWPYRFIELSLKNKIWSSLWLRHLDPPARAHKLTTPFWLWTVVHDHLYRARYCPSDEETNAAIKYLKRNNTVINKSALARLLGVAVVRRKGISL